MRFPAFHPEAHRDACAVGALAPGELTELHPGHDARRDVRAVRHHMDDVEQRVALPGLGGGLPEGFARAGGAVNHDHDHAMGGRLPSRLARHL